MYGVLRVHSQLFAPQGHCVIGTHGNGVAQGAVGEWCIFVTVNIQSHLYAIMDGERGWQDRFNYSHFLLHFATIRHLFNGHFLPISQLSSACANFCTKVHGHKMGLRAGKLVR